MNFKDIVKNAIEINCDVDADGNVDGAIFAAEQIIQDLNKQGYSLVTKTGRPAGSGLVVSRPKKKRR